MDRNKIINDIVISLDMDWAPDFIIDAVANMFLLNKVKATWFITHDSDGVQRLIDHPDLFEIGVHPNFMSVVPNAKSVRTHGMLYSAVLSRTFAVDFGLEIDSSIFLAEMPYIIPHQVFYGDKSLIRMPYFWSDDGEMSITQSPSFELSNKEFNKPGLKILDFHPIHVFLNSENMDNYNLLKKNVIIKDCTKEDTKPFINIGNGSASLLQQIIRSNPNPGGFKTISEIANDWKKS